jgi:hypothetical protein
MPEFNEDRAALLPLIHALDASPLALKRDLVRDEGRTDDWTIHGTFGHIYPDGAGYLLCVMSDESARRWSNVKARLGFCRLTQDGDNEGCLRLDRLPTPHEAGLIREALGIRKRRHLCDDAKAKARAAAAHARVSINRPLAA